jgi:hypothetical protein
MLLLALNFPPIAGEYDHPEHPAYSSITGEDDNTVMCPTEKHR